MSRELSAIIGCEADEETVLDVDDVAETVDGKGALVAVENGGRCSIV